MSRLSKHEHAKAFRAEVKRRREIDRQRRLAKRPWKRIDLSGVQEVVPVEVVVESAEIVED
jgi:hypothetical protein